MVTADGRVDGPGPSASFSIPASAAGNSGRRVLKNGDSFAVLDEVGHAQAGGPAAEGLFFEDTRYLSLLRLTIGGRPPLLLSSAVTAGNTMLAVDLANPELGGLPASSVHVLNSIVLGPDALFATVAVENFGIEAARFELALALDADFVDVFELRGSVRARRGELFPVAEGPVFAYRGLDGVTRRSLVTFDPAPRETVSGRAVWAIDLPPGGRETIRVEVHCERSGRPASNTTRRGSRAEEQEWESVRRARVTGVRAGNEAFDDWLRSSRADLDMLSTETPQGLYPYAGVPWFSTAFGRDGLITALQCLWLDPDLAAGTLRFLAANQATAVDPDSDAEPGKILHERRLGEMAALGEVPFGRYYGTIDATPLFVMLAAAYHARTGDLALIRTLWPQIDAALVWMTRYGDRDGDGFIEYDRKAAGGLDNQGWKDSRDSISHADGSLAEPPIALVEVQAYAYAAYAGAACLAEALGLGARAGELTEAAERLKRRFDAAFWIDELGTYALALDGAKRPCRVRASNAGHALLTGIALPERAARLAQDLSAPAMFSGWGVRTLAEGEARHNPISYHNGSVWPHDNALIALGLCRYGLTEPALAIARGLFDAAARFPLKRLPELFCGFARRSDLGPDMGPTAYPLACAPQAWSAAAVFGVMGGLLGIGFAPADRRIVFTRPVLPNWLGDVTLTNLRLGEASADIVLRRTGDRADDVAVDVVRRDGPVEIVVAPR
jgi:glycogen debranching enzyme